MKMIDEKGRLFGKVNYFDLLIVLVILVGIIGFVGLRKTENVSILNITDNQEVELTLYIPGVRDVTVNNFSVGDVVKSAETKKVIGEIVDIDVENQMLTTTNEAGVVVKSEVPDRFDIKLYIKAKGQITANDVTIGNKIVKIGMYLPIETKVIHTNPIVFGIEID